MERRNFLRSLSLLALTPVVDKLEFLSPPVLPNNTPPPLELKTNGVERMRLFSNGSIGIGTTSPSYSLKLKTE